MSSGIADRYATALFELALDTGAVDQLQSDADALAAAIESSDDLSDVLSSPIYGREDAENAIGKVAEAMGLSPLTGNTLKLMAQNRRLFAAPALIRAVQAKIADHKGIVTADVVSAKALTKTQSEKLVSKLKAAIGKDVKLNATVDESLIGGLVVKLGSKMIDTSIRSQLGALKNTMKEVG